MCVFICIFRIIFYVLLVCRISFEIYKRNQTIYGISLFILSYILYNNSAHHPGNFIFHCITYFSFLWTLTFILYNYFIIVFTGKSKKFIKLLHHSLYRIYSGYSYITIIIDKYLIIIKYVNYIKHDTYNKQTNMY